MTLATRPLSLVVSLLLLFSLACSHAVKVPETEYGNPGGAVSYRIVTTNDRKFSATRYALTDSTIVVEELVSVYPPATEKRVVVPFEIPLNEVASIERVGVDRGKSSLVVLGVGAVLLGILFMMPVTGGMN